LTTRPRNERQIEFADGGKLIVSVISSTFLLFFRLIGFLTVGPWEAGKDFILANFPDLQVFFSVARFLLQSF
jgi:hypothetical protein